MSVYLQHIDRYDGGLIIAETWSFHQFISLGNNQIGANISSGNKN